MTSSERKRQDRERKRQERQALKAAGAPTPGVLDRALCDALRDVVCIALGHPDLRPRNVLTAAVSIREVLKFARRELSERGLDKRACDAALVARLAPLNGAPSRSEAKPVSKAIVEPEAYLEPDPEHLTPGMQALLDDLEWALQPMEPEDV
ncbi:hypothetical protein ACFOYU_10395 [Microvirga sp. GCM10011540]|uniref:hypothetical protein n=1 Tax=Microvirga sp. GCM10011540 TaxID=3317338 RepID=UPI003622CFA7